MQIFEGLKKCIMGFVQVVNFVSNVCQVQWAIPRTRNEGSMFIQLRSCFVVDTPSVDMTTVRTHNIQICQSIRCKQIDKSTADQFTATFQSNAAMPP